MRSCVPLSREPYDATEAARRLWPRCCAMEGSHAERHLDARGLSRCRFSALVAADTRERLGSATGRRGAGTPVCIGRPLRWKSGRPSFSETGRCL